MVNVGKDSIHGAYGNHWLKLSESHHFALFLLLPRIATTKVVDKSQCTCRQGQPNWYETKLLCARMWYLLYVDWSLTRLSWPLNEFVLWLLTYLIVWCSKIWHREYGEQQFKAFFWKKCHCWTMKHRLRLSMQHSVYRDFPPWNFLLPAGLFGFYLMSLVCLVCLLLSVSFDHVPMSKKHVAP